MFNALSPAGLAWDEVDPADHPFDPASAAQVVHSLGPARRVPSRLDPDADLTKVNWAWEVAKPWSDAMTHVLIERYGRWAAGWRWSLGEGDVDGGPVGNWCCGSHSITTPEQTLDHVVAALCEWRDWLERLAEWFEAYPLDPETLVADRILWERTARNLILQVADRTGAESGWYGHCQQVLGWFLSYWGVAPELAERLVQQAVGGRFKSWTAPDTVLAEDVAEQLVGPLRPQDTHWSPDPGQLLDHLERWLAVRESVPWPDGEDSTHSEPVTPARDGAAEDFRSFDAAVDPARAAGLLTALDLVRADAACGAALDFELLRGWQQHVLGTPEPPLLRAHPAFAKGGEERYGIGPDTRTRLDACLAQAADSRLSPAAGAARAYLDVCFFHPFDDGNARAALLTLLFVLARAGITLDSVVLIRRFGHRADDPQDALSLCRSVEFHLRQNRAAAQ
ncbi:Fic family protein [Streptomyces sp. BE20]|uniref:Fic family protein n=1 Tax=Streptomyces sp. BE20 TaxID=3002525 RepID=UPI002E75CE01|nr:Fic family protein [Streptomyces sp. BE20]MEE1822426.1 Fic family protein [Streptomyces sp. BE20]